MTNEPIGIGWFRRDLRLHDNASLRAALDHGRVICLFVVDDRLRNGRFASRNREWFIRESLAELAEAVRARGGAFIVRNGPPESVVPAIAREFGASAVFVSRDYSPYGRARDQRVVAALQDDGVEFVESPGVLGVEPEAVVNDKGAGFGVFSAFYRRWEVVERGPVLGMPKNLTAPEPFDAPSGIDDWHVERPVAEVIDPGEHAARTRLAEFARGDSAVAYAGDRDRLDLGGTSRLSQDFRAGLLSPREVLARLDAPGAARFRQEVAWRDFYTHLAWHQPRVLREPFRADMKRLRWKADEEGWDAWTRGLTGFPVVDASMRQLVATGWMHNRGRMITASFLAKNLFIDYRRGEQFFMRHLTDGDPAVNNGGWQWSSSVGTDAQPYFRVFNPVLQGKKFDPDGEFVRRWVPELERVPLKYLHAPWTMPAAVQAQVHCVLGTHYPGPIVAPEGAIPRATQFFEAATKSNT